MINNGEMLKSRSYYFSRRIFQSGNVLVRFDHHPWTSFTFHKITHFLFLGLWSKMEIMLKSRSYHFSRRIFQSGNVLVRFDHHPWTSFTFHAESCKDSYTIEVTLVKSNEYISNYGPLVDSWPCLVAWSGEPWQAMKKGACVFSNDIKGFPYPVQHRFCFELSGGSPHILMKIWSRVF